MVTMQARLWPDEELPAPLAPPRRVRVRMEDLIASALADAAADDELTTPLRPKLVEAVKRRGVEERIAKSLAALLLQTLRSEFAGETIYVPSARRSLRNQVLAEFNGRNVGEVAKKLGIHKSTVYRYLGTRHRKESRSS